MDLRTRILEGDQAPAAQNGQAAAPADPNALATIGKAIAGLAMRAQFNDLNAFLKEFKGTEIFQTLLKNNPEAAGNGASFEELFKSEDFKKALQQPDTDGKLFNNKEFTLAEILNACFKTKKGSKAYENVHAAFKEVFGFDYAK